MPPQTKAILCLCHDATTLKVRKLLLEHFGYKVFATGSVDSAKQLAAERCPDLLLMDNNHPAANCAELAAAMKEICPAMLAVVLSPYFATRPSGDGEVDHFIPEDEAPENLAAQIRELLSQERVRHDPSDRVGSGSQIS